MMASSRKSPRSSSFRDGLLGVTVGGAVALFIVVWFGVKTVNAIERSAILDNAIATSIVVAERATSAAIASSGIDHYQQTIERSREVLTDDMELRLVRIEGKKLLGSTADSFSAARALRADEKHLYDRAKTLKANKLSNNRESSQRKPEILLTNRGGNQYSISVPYGSDEILGQVQIDGTHPEFESDQGFIWQSFGIWLLAIGAYLATCKSLGNFGSSRMHRVSYAVVITVLAIIVATNLLSLSIESAQIDALENTARHFAGGVSDGSPLSGELKERQSSLQVGNVGSVLLGALLALLFASGLLARLYRTFVEHRTSYAYVMPAVIGTLVLVFFPFLYGVVLSFTDTTLLNESTPLAERWIGFSNYADILGDVAVFQSTADGLAVDYSNFYWTLLVTVIWTISNVSIGVSVGLGLALLLNIKGLRFRALYRVLLILPWAVPSYITALTWRGLFHHQFGVINQVVQMFGGEPVAWFDSVFSSFLTGLAANGWLSFPFMMVVSLGALQSINEDMYEAADLEGASWRQQFRYITLPSLAPALIPAVILAVVWTFNAFNVIYLVSGGQPAGANEILITQAFRLGFEQYQYGYSAAYSVVIFVILLMYGYFQTSESRKRGAIT